MLTVFHILYFSSKVGYINKNFILLLLLLLEEEEEEEEEKDCMCFGVIIYSLLALVMLTHLRLPTVIVSLSDTVMHRRPLCRENTISVCI